MYQTREQKKRPQNKTKRNSTHTGTKKKPKQKKRKKDIYKIETAANHCLSLCYVRC